MEAMKPTKGKMGVGYRQADRQTARPSLCRLRVGSTPHHFLRA